MNFGGISVHQAGEIEAAGGDFESRAGKASQLLGGDSRLITNRTQKLPDMLRIIGNLPGDIGLHENAQTIFGANVMQSAGCGPKAQIDRYRAVDWRRQFERQSGAHDHPDRVAKARNDDGLTRTDENEAGRRQERQNDHRSNDEAAAVPEGRIGPVLTVMIMMVVMMAVT